MRTSTTVPGKRWAVASAVVVGGVTLIYVWLIATESTPSDLARVAAVVALLVLATACSIGAAVLDSPDSRHLTAAAGTGLSVSLGVLALSSIGLLLLVAGGLSIIAIAAGRAERRTTRPIVVIGAFAVGAALPWVLVLSA